MRIVLSWTDEVGSIHQLRFKLDIPDHGLFLRIPVHIDVSIAVDMPTGNISIGITLGIFFVLQRTSHLLFQLVSHWYWTKPELRGRVECVERFRARDSGREETIGGGDGDFVERGNG